MHRSKNPEQSQFDFERAIGKGRDLPKGIHRRDGKLYARISYLDENQKLKHLERIVPPECDPSEFYQKIRGDMEAAGILLSARGNRRIVATVAAFSTAPTKTWIGSIYSQAKRNAKARKIEFNLSLSEFKDLVKQADGKCQVSGIPFCDLKYQGCSRRPFRPSLDRIDNSKGYSLDNCRIVCQIVNIAMNAWGFQPLMILAERLVAARMGKPILAPLYEEQAKRKKRRSARLGSNQ